MRLICRRALLLLGVCLLAGVVSAWAQQAVVAYQLSSVPTTVASTGDSEVLGSVRFQVVNVTNPTGVGIPTGPYVLAQGVQIVLSGISCDNNSLSGMALSVGTSAASGVSTYVVGAPPAGNVAFASSPYDANNTIVPGSCVIGLNVNVANTDTAPSYGLPAVGDWFQVDGIRARMEFFTGPVGSSVNASAILQSSQGSGEIVPPNLVQVATPFTVLAVSVSAGVYVNCIESETPIATINVSEPYQADFVDYTQDDSSTGAAVADARPTFGASNGAPNNGTEILLTIGNVPDGVTLTFPASVPGNVPPPDDADAGDHLVLVSGGTITGPATSATVLYSYTCYNQQVCDTVYETFGISPAVTSSGLSTTGVVTAQAQVDPYDVTASTPLGGVPSFTSPPTTNIIRPRWSDMSIPVPAAPFITFVPCSTTLLFPWAVSIPGFDTGIVINNTTQDYTNAAALPASVLIAPPNWPTVTPTNPEAGTCTLYYFPSNEAPALYYTTPSISTGGTWATMMSTTPFAGKTGYMIARCNFQFGHGYATIGQGTSAGALTFTEAYIPLVIPDPVVYGFRADYNAAAITFSPVGESLDQ